MKSEMVQDLFINTSSRDSVYTYAEKLTATQIVALLTCGEELHWRKEYLAEVVVSRMRHMNAQGKIIAYLEMVGHLNPAYLPKGLNRRSFDALVKRGTVVLEHKSRERQDDMEMVYWIEARLA